MTDRKRVSGYRIPRRLERGKAQRTHPVTVKREERESYLKWLEHRGLPETPSNLMKYVYRSDRLLALMPDLSYLMRHIEYKVGAPPGKPMP